MQPPSVIQRDLLPTKNTVRHPAVLLQDAAFPIVLFLLAHTALGLLFRQSPSLGTVHAYISILLGVIWALSKPQLFAAFIAAYIVGAEVLWRMTSASVPWEIGKYAVVLILGLSLLHHRKKRIPFAPLIYFVLLLPSILLTLSAVDFSTARELISFNLSGPLALLVSVWFFSGMSITISELIRILLMLIAPLAAVASYALSLTFSVDQIQWVNDSMFTTSGGFGPNQVSTVMGLGLAAVCILLLIWKGLWHTKWFLIIVGVTLLVQGLLTFSRGGMISAVAVVGFAVWHFLRGTRNKGQLLLLAIIMILFLILVVLPLLNNFTGGFLELRFSDSNLSNRDEILLQEIQTFENNPIAGIGPGMGGYLRGVAAHTEMTRLLAEHGTLGLMSLAVLFVTAIHRYFTTKLSKLRGLYGGWMLWSLLIMTNAAMRLAAISFMFGLGFIQINGDESK